MQALGSAPGPDAGGFIDEQVSMARVSAQPDDISVQNPPHHILDVTGLQDSLLRSPAGKYHGRACPHMHGCCSTTVAYVKQVHSVSLYDQTIVEMATIVPCSCIPYEPTIRVAGS